MTVFEISLILAAFLCFFLVLDKLSTKGMLRCYKPFDFLVTDFGYEKRTYVDHFPHKVTVVYESDKVALIVFTEKQSFIRASLITTQGSPSLTIQGGIGYDIKFEGASYLIEHVFDFVEVPGFHKETWLEGAATPLGKSEKTLALMAQLAEGLKVYCKPFLLGEKEAYQELEGACIAKMLSDSKNHRSEREWEAISSAIGKNDFSVLISTLTSLSGSLSGNESLALELAREQQTRHS